MFKHDLPFDPTYGYDLKGLLEVGSPDPPGDFSIFWQQTHAAIRKLGVRLECKPCHLDNPFVHVEEFRLVSLGGVRIGGWLTRPKDRQPERGLMVSHGYGGREGPDLPTEEPAVPTITMYPVCRGLPRLSIMPGVRCDAGQHVLVGMEDRETYIHRGCVADLWAATQALVSISPQVANGLDFFGVSFGGGIGAIALAFEPRFRRAVLAMPSFGNHPLRVTLTCVGSGQSVRETWMADSRVLEVLQYFDSATAARQVTTPTLVACARFDPAVPPPGQFAVYNALNCEKELFIAEAGHFEFEGLAEQDAAFAAAMDNWFAD